MPENKQSLAIQNTKATELLNNSQEYCTSILSCVHDFQTLISGVFAILAALLTAHIIWKSASLPIKAKENKQKEDETRRLHYLYSILAGNLREISARAQQTPGSIKVHKAANTSVSEKTKDKLYLELHSIADEWEHMSLLPKETLSSFSRLRRLISDHNYDISRARGAFGDDNFANIISTRAKNIRSSAFELSNEIIALQRKA